MWIRFSILSPKSYRPHFKTQHKSFLFQRAGNYRRCTREPARPDTGYLSKSGCSSETSPSSPLSFCTLHSFRSVSIKPSSSKWMEWACSSRETKDPFPYCAPLFFEPPSSQSINKTEKCQDTKPMWNQESVYISRVRETMRNCLKRGLFHRKLPVYSIQSADPVNRDDCDKTTRWLRLPSTVHKNKSSLPIVTQPCYHISCNSNHSQTSSLFIVPFPYLIFHVWNSWLNQLRVENTSTANLLVCNQIRFSSPNE